MTNQHRRSISQDDTVLDPSLEGEERPLPGFSLDSLVDQVLDERYAVDQLIGMGAMGAVFQARQLRLRRTVALKVPKPSLCLEEEFLRRFEREALTMAKVVHQNIVQIFDVYVSPDYRNPSFIAMEYVEGTQLDHFLKTQKETLTVSGVIDLFRQIANGVDAAHRHGIVHRDIKPSNILVTMPQRVPKIMDFGIAQVEMEDAYKTTEGAGMMGTPAFMAPEQITGGDITPATDVYALGMVLYKLLGGKAPWTTKNTHELLFAKVNTTPHPASQRNEALPGELDSVLSRALAVDPEVRQQTTAELVEEVSRALEPLRNLSFGELFDLEATQTALTRLERPREQEQNARMPALAILAVALTIVAIVTALVLTGKKPAPGESRDDVVKLNTVPQKTETEVATVPPVPATPTPKTAEAREQATELKPLPEPTVTPVPTLTPVPSPQATPQETVSPASRWDSEANPPTVSRFRRESILEELETWLADEIRTPVYRRQFGRDHNALARIGDEAARDLLSRLETLQDKNSSVSLYFDLREDSTVWDDRTILRLDATVKGHPKTHPNPNYRVTLWEGTEPLKARLERTADDGWRLVSFEGPIN